MSLYNRLYELNKSKYIKFNTENRVRIEKKGTMYIIRKQDCDDIILLDLNVLYNFLVDNKYYIENFSILKATKKFFNNWCFSNEEWSKVVHLIGDIGYVNSFSVVKVDDIDYLTVKTILTGNLLYKTPFFILVLTNNRDIKLITDINLYITDKTNFNFKKL